MGNNSKEFLGVEMCNIQSESNNLGSDFAKSLSETLSTAGSTKEMQTESIMGTKENPNGISTTMAFFLNFRSLIGIGILAFPHTVQEVGFWVVICTYPFIVTGLVYGLDLIIKTADDMGYYGSSLEQFVEIVLGKVHRTLTTICNWLICFAICVASVILAVQFVEFSTCQLGFCFANARLWLNLLGLIICLPTIFIHNINNFKYLATGALAVILFSVVAIIAFETSFISENGISQTAQTANMWRFPEFFGVMCFAIEGVGTIMPVRNVMKNRQHFRPMFLMSLGTVCVLLLAFGILGAMTFGGNTKDIVFLNFPKTQMFFFTLQMVYGLSCIITFPIYVNVACSIIFRIDKLKGWFMEHPRAYWHCTFLRLVTILMLFAISISGIRILDLLNFSGALCNAYLAIIMPIMLYMTYFKDKIKKWQRTLFWIFIAVGCSLTLLSVVVSVKDMAVQHHPKHHT